jgi:pSer/pThr/pTyr-binding forkhead associated (FHA) protein
VQVGHWRANVARLTVYKGDKKAAHYDIKSGTIRVGRHPDSEVFLPDQAVSRLQLVLEKTRAGWVAKPGKGKVAVILGDEPLTEPHLLAEDSRLEFGQYAIRFSEHRDSSDANVAVRTGEYDPSEAVLAAVGPVPQPMGGEEAESTIGLTPEKLEEMRVKAEELSRPHLVWKESGQERMLNLDQGPIFIGKGDCDIKIPGGLFVGARHARVTQVPDGFVVILIAKLGKVLVNGEKIREYRLLRHRDVMQIGSVSITFRSSLYAGV